MKKIKVITDFELTPKQQESLVLMYQVVFSFNALNLFMTLYVLGQENETIQMKDLIQILKCTEDDILTQRQELEQMNLMDTYTGIHDTYVLKEPLQPKEFIQHAMYGRLFSMVAGQETYKRMVLKYIVKAPTIEGQDITKRFDANRLAVWDENLEKEFAKQDINAPTPSPIQNNTYQEPKVSEPSKTFDVDAFFESIPTIVYPNEFRTAQLKGMIESAGSTYNVDMETMKRFVLDSSNFEQMKFNTQKFVSLLEREFGRMKVDASNPYEVDPISFIRHKQGYDYVVGSDQNLIKSLTENFGFSNPVINVLIEYVLDVNQNNLNKSYVEKIASTWKRNGVTTVEEAKAQLQPKESRTQDSTLNQKNSYSPKVKKTRQMPEYTEEHSLSNDEEEALRLSIQKLLDEDGTS